MFILYSFIFIIFFCYYFMSFFFFFFFFFNDTATTEIYTLSLHDALPILIEHGHLVGADRHGGGIGQRRAQASFARGISDLGAADFRIAVAERDRQLHRNDVDRAHQRLRERHRAGKAAAVVFRAPVADADRRVDYDRGRLEPVHQGSGVDIGLERGARRAHGVGRAVELALAVVASADHGAHRAVDVHQHRGALLGLVFAPVLLERVLECLLGVVLQVDVEGKAHDEHALVHGLGQGFGQLLHLVEGPIEIIIGRTFVAPVDCYRGITAGAKHLALGHESGLDQIVQDDVRASARRRQIDVRGKSRRRLEQAGQHGCLGEGYLARGLVEIILCRRIDAEGAAAEIGAIKVELENFVLGQPCFQPEREERLLDLALDGPLVRQEEVLGQLLADGGTTLHHAARARIGEHRAEEAGKVDAEMLVEAAIFGGERCLDQVVGKLIERDRVIVPDAARTDFIAVAVEEGDRELGFLQPVVVRGFAESGDREREHDQQTRIAQRQALRQRLNEAPAPPARDVKAVHEDGEALIKLASPGPGLVQSEVDAGIEIEQEASQLDLPADWIPAVLKKVAQGSLRAEGWLRRGAGAQPLSKVLTDPAVQNYGDL